MNYQEFQELLTPQGQKALQEAQDLTPTESTFLQYHKALTKNYSSSLARTALGMAILRQKAEKNSLLPINYITSKKHLNKQPLGKLHNIEPNDFNQQIGFLIYVHPSVATAWHLLNMLP